MNRAEDAPHYTLEVSEHWLAAARVVTLDARLYDPFIVTKVRPRGWRAAWAVLWGRWECRVQVGGDHEAHRAVFNADYAPCPASPAVLSSPEMAGSASFAFPPATPAYWRRWLGLPVLIVFLLAGCALSPVHAGEQGFVDLYGGVAGLPESDVPGFRYADLTEVVGARVGLWLGPSWALTFRGWYHQTDVLDERGPEPDLAVLGGSLELMARWDARLAWVKASLGPALAVMTLDRGDQDARALAPGLSGGLGLERPLWGPVRAFVEYHGAMLYPCFHYPDRTLTPRIWTHAGVGGLRVGF